MSAARRETSSRPCTDGTLPNSWPRRSCSAGPRSASGQRTQPRSRTADDSVPSRNGHSCGNTPTPGASGSISYPRTATTECCLLTCSARCSNASATSSTRTPAHSPSATPRSCCSRSGSRNAHAPLLEDGLPCFNARTQQLGEARAVDDRVAERQLVELRALEEQVYVVLPREADAAVHLQRGAGDSLRRVGAPRLRG